MVFFNSTLNSMNFFELVKALGINKNEQELKMASKKITRTRVEKNTSKTMTFKSTEKDSKSAEGSVLV